MRRMPRYLRAGLACAAVLVCAVVAVGQPGPWKPRAVEPPPAPAAPPPAPSTGWKPRTPTVSPGVVPVQATDDRPPYLPPVGEELQAGPELPPPEEVPVGPMPRPVAPVPRKSAPPAKLTADDELPAPRRLVDTPPATEPEDRPELRALLGGARAKVRLGQYEEAAKDFADYLRQRPDNTRVRSEYAGVLVSAGLLRESVEQLQVILRSEPRDVESRELIGDVYTLLKDYKNAIDQYRAILRVLPENLDVTAKLARVYAFAGRREEAARLYQEKLGKLLPDDEDSPRLQGAVLIDLERPEDALPYLRRQVADHPDDVQLIGFLIRAYARLGQQDRAAEGIRQLAERAKESIEPRLRLADDLYNGTDFDLAGQVYAQVLRLAPGNTQAIIGAARVQMQLFHPQPAKQLLESMPKNTRPGEKYWRSFVLAWAEYHQLVGEYLEAARIYKQLLVLDANDYEIRLSLGKLYDFFAEWEFAKAEFSKIPPTATPYRQARVGIAGVLAAQRYFPQAITEYQRLLAENPDDADVAASLARVLSKSGNVIEAESVCRGYLAGRAKYPSQAVAMRLALARVYSEHGKFVEAHGEYDTLVKTVPGRVPETYYGLSRSAYRIGRVADAKAALVALINPLDSDARSRLQVADLYNADFDDGGVVQMTQAVLKYEPDNLAALVRLGDAQVRIARQNADPGPATATATAILKQSPANARGLLVQARCLAIAQDFKSAARWYERLLTADPEYNIPRRERARVIYADHQFSAASAAYLQSPAPADLQIQADVAALAAKDDKVGPALTPLARARLSGPELRDALDKLASQETDPELQQAFYRVLIDYDARRTVQTGFQLEEKAKSLKDFRNYEAVPVYRELLELEPTSTEARFDIGQVFAGLKQTRNELREYGDLLRIDPLFREGAVATERATLELMPQARFALDVFDETGRNGLASITRLRYTNFAFVPIGDENELVRFGYTPVNYIPKDGSPDLRGHILTVGLDKKCVPDLLFTSLLNYEIYPDRISSRPTGRLGLRWDIGDYGHLEGSLFLENVIENGEALRQDIFRGGFNFGGDVRPTRFWVVGGNYRGAAYSDGNWLNEIYLFNDVSLTLPPRQLKVVSTVDVIAFNEESLAPDGSPIDFFTNTGSGATIGITHPYFAPNGFGIFETRLEWWHYLSRDYFTHANQVWYSLQAGLAVDTAANFYTDLRALSQYDVASCLSLGLAASVYTSPVYTAATGLAYAHVRFPVRYR